MQSFSGLIRFQLMSRPTMNAEPLKGHFNNYVKRKRLRVSLQQKVMTVKKLLLYITLYGIFTHHLLKQ